MAGANATEFPPLLPAGFHDINETGRHNLCVQRFPSSITRPRLLTNVETVIASINRNAIAGHIWIDGSFLTEKLNPGDVDIAFVISANVLNGLNLLQRSFFEQFRSTSLKQSLGIDNYGVVVDENDPRGELMYVYWLKQFAFSRSDEMKGILRVPVPFVVSP